MLVQMDEQRVLDLRQDYLLLEEDASVTILEEARLTNTVDDTMEGRVSPRYKMIRRNEMSGSKSKRKVKYSWCRDSVLKYLLMDPQFGRRSKSDVL